MRKNKYYKIMDELATLRFKFDKLERLASDTAVNLEQALNRAESQRDAFKHQRDTIMEERDALRSENERLRNELHALDGRLRHLLQSKTIQLFDEKDRQGGYRYDIKILDACATVRHCITCKHLDEPKDVRPCPQCSMYPKYSNWEPKE